jgi:hypothetical protein
LADAAPFGGRNDELPAAEDEPEVALRARLERYRQIAREERRQRGGPIAAVAAAARALEQQLMQRNVLRREAIREKDDEDHKGRNPEEERRNRADDGRNLIYHGTPTGGNKYPFLVSMWASITNNVRTSTFRCVARHHPLAPSESPTQETTIQQPRHSLCLLPFGRCATRNSSSRASATASW